MNAFSLGLLIALYERAVGFYAELINVNAYDQPGVEAGKRAADRLLGLRDEIESWLVARGISAGEARAEDIALAWNRRNDVEMIFKWLEFLRAQS
jgi:glucose-6-phosphate isomerase